MTGMFQNPMAPADDKRDWPIMPPMPKVFTPEGEMLAVQVVRGPYERVEENSIHIELPQSVTPTRSGLKYKTPVMRVIAVGPEVKGYVEGDFVLLAPGVQVLEVWHSGYTQICVHRKGLLGKVESQFIEKEWTMQIGEALEGLKEAA